MHPKTSPVRSIKLPLVAACIAAALAAVLLYRGFTTAIAQSDQEAALASQVLPYGKTLDFTLIKKFNPEGKLFSYPKVTPGEVGLPLENLISR